MGSFKARGPLVPWRPSGPALRSLVGEPGDCQNQATEVGSNGPSLVWVDAVEKVGSVPPARNNRIAGTGFLYRSCAFDARLESILLASPLQNPFSTASTKCEKLAVSKCFPVRPQKRTPTDRRVMSHCAMNGLMQCSN